MSIDGISENDEFLSLSALSTAIYQIAEDLGANEDGLQEQEDKEDDDPEQEEYGYGTSDDDEGDEDNDDKQGNHTGATEPGGESGCEENWDIEDEHGDIGSARLCIIDLNLL